MIKSKLNILMISACLSLSCIFVGCNSNSQSGEVTSLAYEPIAADLLANELIDSGAFSDEMATIESSYIEMLYGISSSLYTEATVYMGSGATAERICVFKYDGDENKQALLDAVTAHIETQKEVYASYMPNEVEKLKNSYVNSNDTYVVFVVADDAAKVTDIMQKYM